MQASNEGNKEARTDTSKEMAKKQLVLAPPSPMTKAEPGRPNNESPVTRFENHI